MTPTHLKTAGRRLWEAATSDFLIDAPGLELLRLAAEALDRADEAREAIERDGPYQRDRFDNVMPHPALGVERDSRLAAARLIRQLGLTDPPSLPPIAAKSKRGPKPRTTTWPPDPPHHPPRVSARRREAVRTRDGIEGRDVRVRR
jgi:hypothetical protein